MGDDQSNPAPNRDPGDETRAHIVWVDAKDQAGCDIYGYPVVVKSHWVTDGIADDEEGYHVDGLAALRDAADESEPDERDTEIAKLRSDLRIAHLNAQWADYNRQPLSTSWHHLECITTGLPDPRVQHPLWVAIRRGWKS